MEKLYPNKQSPIELRYQYLRTAQKIFCVFGHMMLTQLEAHQQSKKLRLVIIL